MTENPTPEQMLEAEKRKRLCKLAIKKQLFPLEKQVSQLKQEIAKQALANSIEKIPNDILKTLDDVKKKMKILSGLSWDDVWDEYHKQLRKKIKKLQKEIKILEIKLSMLQCPEFTAVDKQELQLEDLPEYGQMNYMKRAKYEKLELEKLQQLDLLTGQDSAQKKQMEAIEKQTLAALNDQLKAFTTPLDSLVKTFPEVKIPGLEELTQLLQLIPIIAEQLAKAEQTIESQKNTPPQTDLDVSEAAKQSLNTAFKEASDMCEMPELSPEFQKKLDDISDAVLAIASNIPSIVPNVLVIIVFYALNMKIPIVEKSLLDIAAEIGESHVAQIVSLVQLVPQIPTLVTNLHPQVKKIVKKKLQSIQKLQDIAKFLTSGNVLNELDKVQVEASVESCPLKEQQNVEKQEESLKKQIKDLKKQLNDMKEEQKKLASVELDAEDEEDEEKAKAELFGKKKKDKKEDEDDDLDYSV